VYNKKLLKEERVCDPLYVALRSAYVALHAFDGKFEELRGKMVVMLLGAAGAGKSTLATALTDGVD